MKNINMSDLEFELSIDKYVLTANTLNSAPQTPLNSTGLD